MNLYTLYQFIIFLIFKFIIRLSIKLIFYFIISQPVSRNILYDKFLSRRITLNFTQLIKKKNKEVRTLRVVSYVLHSLVSQRGSTINYQMVFREFRRPLITYICLNARTMVCSRACACNRSAHNCLQVYECTKQPLRPKSRS